MKPVATDACIDFGTRKLAISRKDRGITYLGPSVLALQPSEASNYQIGNLAIRDADLRINDVELVWPINRGHITNVNYGCALLKSALSDSGFPRSRRAKSISVGIPSGLTPLQKRALEQVIIGAGASRVHLVPNTIAAAYGSGIRLSDTSGVLIADIGAGHTDIAVLAYDEIVRTASVPFGGLDIYSIIGQRISSEFQLQIPINSLDRNKTSLFVEGNKVKLIGIDCITGLPKEITLSSDWVVALIERKASIISGLISRVLEESMPELSGDIACTGILLTGGFALLPGLKEDLHNRMQFPVTHSEQGELCVIRGLEAISSQAEAPLKFNNPLKRRTTPWAV